MFGKLSEGFKGVLGVIFEFVGKFIAKIWHLVEDYVLDIIALLIIVFSWEMSKVYIHSLKTQSDYVAIEFIKRYLTLSIVSLYAVKTVMKILASVIKILRAEYNSVKNMAYVDVDEIKNILDKQGKDILSCKESFAECEMQYKARKSDVDSVKAGIDDLARELIVLREEVQLKGSIDRQDEVGTDEIRKRYNVLDGVENQINQIGDGV